MIRHALPPGLWTAVLPGALVVGPGARRELGGFIGTGARVVAVVSRSTADLVAELLPDGVRLLGRAVVVGEPTLDGVTRMVTQVRLAEPDLLVAVGGGSVLDTAKALAAFVPNREHPPRSYLEVVGQGLPLRVDPLPVLALPTTAGTGSEATHNAVLRVPDAARKVSLRDRRLTPRAALVDPELGVAVPRPVAVAAGLDAAVQLVEAAVTPRATPLSAAIAWDGARVALPALGRLVAGDADAHDRAGLAYGALCSGLALANGGLGTIHGIAAVLGGHTELAHGVLCGRLAAPVLAANLAAGDGREAQAAREGYAELARIATGRASGPEGLVRWFAGLVADAELPPVALDDLDLAAIVTAVGEASSTRGNPVVLDAEVLRGVLRAGAG